MTSPKNPTAVSASATCTTGSKNSLKLSRIRRCRRYQTRASHSTAAHERLRLWLLVARVGVRCCLRRALCVAHGEEASLSAGRGDGVAGPSVGGWPSPPDHD